MKKKHLTQKNYIGAQEEQRPRHQVTGRPVIVTHHQPGTENPLNVASPRGQIGRAGDDHQEPSIERQGPKEAVGVERYRLAWPRVIRVELIVGSLRLEQD